MKTQRPILWIGTVWPEPTSSAAGIRTLQLLLALRDAGFAVTFCSPSQPNHFKEALEKENIKTFGCQANDSQFDVFVKNLAPMAVIFDRFVMEEQFSWRVREQVPQALRLIDTQDLHFLRGNRERELLGETPIEAAWQREVASIFRSDGSYLISDFEKNLLETEFEVPPRLLAHLPLGCEWDSASWPAFEARQNFFWIGNFRHPPNWDGLKFFLENHWPYIYKKLPQASLDVYGAYPPKEVMAKKIPGVLIHGPIPDHRKALKHARVNLAPLRFGAGIKGKILEGWAMGCPAVTTTVGAEGMHEVARLPFGGLVVGDADFKTDAFAEACVRLHEDPQLWSECVKKAEALLDGRFRLARVQQSFLKDLESRLLNREGLRARNRIGEVLWQQGLRATEYFSRWIESKTNRLRS